MKKISAKKYIIGIVAMVLVAALTVSTVLAYDSFNHTTSAGISYDGLVTDDNSFMAYGADDGWNVCYVLGRTKDASDPWASTCYKGTGWHVGIYYNQMSDYEITPSGSTLGCGLAISVSPSFSEDGKTLYLTYNITNTKRFTKNFALWTYGIPSVGGSSALNLSVDSTSMTLSTSSDSLTITAYDGAVMWAGNYEGMSISDGGFKNLQSLDYSSYAGAAFYWDGLSLAGNESMTLTASFSIASVQAMDDPDPEYPEPETTETETTEPESDSETETTERETDPNETEEGHEHNYEYAYTAAPTFTTAELKVSKCSCGEISQVLVKHTNGLSNLASGDGNWYYFNNNKVLDITTIANNANGWWYVKNGKVDFTANTIEHNEYGWWYLKDGKVDFSYNGFGVNSNGEWYCEGGQVKFNKTDIIYGTINGEEAWWYVKDSKVDYSTTIAHNMNGWWYCKNGKVDFTYTGLGNNSNGWWYVKDGKVDFTFTGIVPYGSASWYVKGGQVQFGYTGTYKVGTVTYNIKLGKVVSKN